MQGRVRMALSEPAEFGHPDFILLDEVTEAAFMANLKLRYQKGKVWLFVCLSSNVRILCNVKCGRAKAYIYTWSVHLCHHIQVV